MIGQLAKVAMLVGVFTLAFANESKAQYVGMSPDGPTVQGSGSSTIERKPEVLRLRIELSAKSKNLEDALAKLKTMREAATSKLAEMGVDAASVKFEDAQINSAISAQQRQMEMMVRQRMRASGKRGRNAPEKPITVTASLTAEWKLSAASPEELLLQAHTIQQRVRAADLAATKAGEDESEADEEAAEEMAEMSADFEDPSQLKPGEPVFMYVSRISKDEQAKAYAEAFARAKASAEDLSRAAGAELGALRGLSAQALDSSFGGMRNYYGGGYDPTQQYIMQIAAQQSARSGTRLEEAIGSQPNDVALPVHVTATFELKPPASK